MKAVDDLSPPTALWWRKTAGVLLALRTIVLWVLWVSLVTVWVATLAAMSQSGSHGHWIGAGAVVCALILLAYAEGMEIAVADLSDVHPDQLSEPRLRRLLDEIHRARHFFYANRQAVVVLVISLMSLQIAYPWIYIPGLGQVSDYNASFWFSISLTTTTTLWFCQVLPKRLAVLNSELFLHQAAFLWPIIKAIGLLGLPNPSNQLLYFFERFTPYRRKRHLRPSPAAHYNVTSHIFGSSLDRIHVDISVDGSGMATLRKRFAVLFLHGRRTQHSERLYSHKAFSGAPQVRVVGLYVGQAPERLDQISDELDKLFETADASTSGIFTAAEGWSPHVETQIESDLFRGGAWASWTIWSSKPLPEAFWPREGHDEYMAALPMAVLIYEVELVVPESALASPHDARGYERIWPEYVATPCRRYSLRIEPAHKSDAVGLQGCDVRLIPGDISVPDETSRCTQLAISALDSQLDLRFPMQGAVYSIRWWNLSFSLLPSAAELPTKARRDPMKYGETDDPRTVAADRLPSSEIVAPPVAPGPFDGPEIR